MEDCKLILLSSAYLPNIQYFSKLLSGIEVIIEIYDTYEKQSYRNRTTIYGANGPLDLVVPVKRPRGNSTKTCEILLDFDMPWRQIHWKALFSAYNRSPFFEIFEAELRPLYNKKVKYLIDWNSMFLGALMDMIDRERLYSLSEQYQDGSDDKTSDFRDSIHPKKRMHRSDPSFHLSPYFQVFAEKHGFRPNLSFIDLLFNEGSHGVDICLRSIKKGNK